MDDRRPLALIELAAAATLAIVPVLFGVLLAVSWAQGDDASRGRERHVSVRHVAALKTFEHAIVRRDAVRAAAPDADTLLARLPACRREWDGHPSPLRTVRDRLMGTSSNELSPAARLALQLAEIDRALARFSRGDGRRVADPVGFDGHRWIDAVELAMRTPVEASDYPGRSFRVQCSDIAAAVGALARGNGRMLAALAWRGTEVARVVARWQPEQYVEISPRVVARVNPWAGLPGCIYLARGNDAGPARFVSGAREVDAGICARPEMIGSARFDPPSRVGGEPAPDMAPDDARWQVPPSLSTILAPLSELLRPGGSLYRTLTEAPAEDDAAATAANRITVRGNAVDVGFSVDLGIDPDLQALAQRTAACYTGRDDVCRALAIHRKEDDGQPIGHLMLEHAMVRMAAVAIVDVATGRIEALAGALSPCAYHEHDAPVRASGCDSRMPYPIRFRPDALRNPAIFHDAMPASTIKPIMAAAFLSDRGVGARWLAAERAEISRAPGAIPAASTLRAQLMRSDSARFLDRAFCADKGFTDCDRMWSIQATALAFGWNADCSAPHEDCGKRDALFGRAAGNAVDDGAAKPIGLDVPYGRLLAEPSGTAIGAPFALWRRIALDTRKVARCAAGADGRRGTKDDWGKCSGGVVVDVVAEGWGQGHARASALGEAGMMATLAAAANGAARIPLPHLVTAVRRAGSGIAPVLASTDAETGEPARIGQQAAEVILSGLSFGHRAGTSRLACEQVFDAKACQAIDWIGGKTGTPTFPNDDRSLDDLAKLCAPGTTLTSRERVACGPLRPYKWYVAAYRANPGDPRWTKAIGVLVERNWIASSGRVHGAGDHGPNPAAEIAMQIAGRHVGALPWERP